MIHAVQEDHGEVCFVQMCSLQKPNPSADLMGADQTIRAGTAHGCAGCRPAGPASASQSAGRESSLRGEKPAACRRTRAPAAAACGGADGGWHGMIIKDIFLIRHSSAAGARGEVRTAPLSEGSEHSTGGLPGGIKSHLALQRRKALPSNCHAGSPADWFHNTSSSDTVYASGCISEHSPRPPGLSGAVTRFRNKNLFGEIFTTISFYESQS